MHPGLFYRHPYIYEAGMRLLYGASYLDRLRMVAELVAPGSTVVDVCSGPGALYRHFLKGRGCHYLALDMNPRFLARVTAEGGEGRHADVRSLEMLPSADHVIMQGSLYHFLPDAATIVERMLVAARQTVIICEPVRNLTRSSSWMVRSLSMWLTDPGTGPAPHRFTPETLVELMKPYPVLESSAIPGGRDQLVVLAGRRRAV